MSAPKITIVTVCYNAEHEIEATMRSVLNQTCRNLEYIIVDGASKDKTLDIVESLVAEYTDRKVIVVSEVDNGIYDAMNKGVDLATGEWINFMNAGDEFADSRVVEEFFAMADTQRPNDILYGDAIYKYPFGRYYVDSHPDKGHFLFCHQATFARVSLMKRMHFDLSYKISADRHFLLQCQKRGSRYTYFPRVVACFKHYDGLSTGVRNWRRLKIEKYKMEQKSKDLHYFILVIGDFLQRHFHLRNCLIDVQAKELKKIAAANPRMRKIIE